MHSQVYDVGRYKHIKYYEPISQGGIIDEINSLCNTTNESYKNRAKLTRIIEGLDQYWFMAAGSAPQGTFDDTNQTTVPIFTQNLVSGTNQYKLSDFPSNLLQILRITVLNSDGNEMDMYYQPFEHIRDFLEEYGIDADNAKGIPTVWTKIGDFIYVAATPDYNKTDGLRCYANRELSKFQYVTFTTTIATPGVITSVAHGLSDGDALLLITDGALPTGLTAEKTIYYVSGKTDDTFELELTPSSVGGSGITTSGSQSGTHKFVKVSGEPGIPIIHHPFLARYASEKFMKTNHPNFAKTREDLANDRDDIQDYWEAMIRPSKTIMNTKKRSYK